MLNETGANIGKVIVQSVMYKNAAKRVRSFADIVYIYMNVRTF